MKLRTDTIGHFENPTEDIIRAAVIYSGEGTQENDLVKLMIDEEHFVSIWIGQKLEGHTLIVNIPRQSRGLYVVNRSKR